jgi:hypothetical protein
MTRLLGILEFIGGNLRRDFEMIMWERTEYVCIIRIIEIMLYLVQLMQMMNNRCLINCLGDPDGTIYRTDEPGDTFHISLDGKTSSPVSKGNVHKMNCQTPFYSRSENSFTLRCFSSVLQRDI